MPKVKIAYTDARGRLHANPQAATVSDIAALFPGMEGIALGIAHSILDKRRDLERIFAELDEMVGEKPENLPANGK